MNLDATIIDLTSPERDTRRRPASVRHVQPRRFDTSQDPDASIICLGEINPSINSCTRRQTPVTNYISHMSVHTSAQMTVPTLPRRTLPRPTLPQPTLPQPTLRTKPAKTVRVNEPKIKQVQSNNSPPSRATHAPVVECPICMQTHDQVKEQNGQMMATPCGHIFCKDCLKRLWQSTGTGKMVKCPKCRTGISITKCIKIFI